MKHLGIITILGLSIFFQSCRQSPELTEPSSGDAKVDRYAVVGDSYMSGYQDGALYRDGQSRSIGALIARQMELISGNDFQQALMPDNVGLGINLKSWEGQYVKANVMGTRIDCKGEESLGPVKSFHSGGSCSPYLASNAVAELDDYAIPHATIAELFDPNAATNNVFFDRVDATLAFPAPIDNLIDHDPDFVTAWLGMEDIYRYAKNGGYGVTLASAATFSAYLDSMFVNLEANQIDGAIATIPYPEHIPFFTTIPYNGATLTQSKADSLNDLYQQGGVTHITFQEGDNPFVMDDPNAPNSIRQIKPNEFLTIAVPLDSMKCNFYGLLVSAVHDRYVLDTAEIELLRTTIDQYNDAIRQTASQYGLATVEMNSFFASLEEGIKWNGRDFTTEFVSGGFFSLDGYHVNQKGAEIIANHFIDAINDYYNAFIPQINCGECNGILFP